MGFFSFIFGKRKEAVGEGKEDKRGTGIETKSKTSLNFWQACNRRKELQDLKGFKNKI